MLGKGILVDKQCLSSRRGQHCSAIVGVKNGHPRILAADDHLAQAGATGFWVLAVMNSLDFVSHICFDVNFNF